MSDLIDRQMAIDALCFVCGNDCDKTEFVYDAPQWDQVIMCPEHYVLTTLPSAQPESYKEKLKEIADALSEKFAYMNTCLNERDIILGYLGVKRPSKIHCNTDCTNTKCESHRCNKRLPSAQPKISCDGCKHIGRPTTDMPCCACIRKEDNDYYDSE